MYFDGTGTIFNEMDDRYYGDFTVEMWVKFNYASSGANIEFLPQDRAETIQITFKL